MKKILKFYLFFYFFWIIYFVFNKLIFIVYEYQYLKDISAIEILSALGVGLRMDISTTGYFFMIISFLSAILFLLPNLLKKIISWLTYILIVLNSLLLSINLEVYNNWGFHIDHTPLQYIDTPEIYTSSTENWLMITLIILAVALSTGFIFLYKKYVVSKLNDLKPLTWKNALLMLLCSALSFIPIRGSFSTAALNTGMMYISEKQFVNHIGINPTWNFIYSINKYSALSYKIDLMSDEDAEKLLFENLYSSTNGSKILKIDRPNIILIILEGFTPYCMKEFDVENPIMNNFSKIAKEGIFFRNLYANGNRTDKGLVAIFSGYPAQPINSIIKFPQKTQTLPFLSKELKQNGYSLQFNYGGDINFTNIRSYLTNGGFDNIIKENDFPSNLYRGQWGIQDEQIFDTTLAVIAKMKRPFFSATLTLSSHPPYDVPGSENLNSSKETIRFNRAISYTDSCLGRFIDKAKQQTWWDSTLIIMVADHSVSPPTYFQYNQPERYQIPMVWTGGALAVTDTVINRYISQVDISKSILCQLNIETGNFIYSKNIFADSISEFGFYTFNGGFGYVTDSIKYIFDQTSKHSIRYDGITNATDSLFAKAYWQHFNNDFVKR